VEDISYLGSSASEPNSRSPKVLYIVHLDQTSAAMSPDTSAMNSLQFHYKGGCPMLVLMLMLTEIRSTFAIERTKVFILC
jgi:hypothetical protein